MSGRTKFATGNKPKGNTEAAKTKPAPAGAKRQAVAGTHAGLPRFLAGGGSMPSEGGRAPQLPAFAASRAGAAVAMRKCNCGGQCDKCRAGGSGTDLRPGGGQSLDQRSRGALEGHFGADLSQVQVHTGPPAWKSAASLNARAYTVGSDIYFGKGMYAPQTSEGERLLAHEVAHVVQQGMGKTPSVATKLADGMSVGSALDPLERDADRAADEYMGSRRSSDQKRALTSAGGVSIQRSPVAHGVQAMQPVAPVGKAANVETIIARDYPLLLGILTPDAVDRWQEILNDLALNDKLQAQLDALNRRHEEQDRYKADDEFVGVDERWGREQDRIESKMKTPHLEDKVVQIDAQALLSPDFMQLPAWNVAAEKAFREKARQKFVGMRTVAVLELNGPQPQVSVWWGDYKLTTATGYVTFANLLEYPFIKSDYQEEVQNSELVKEVREGIPSVQSFVNHWSYEHHERSEANYPGGDRFVDSLNRVKAKYFRNIAEAIGKGHASYPPLSIWHDPRDLLGRAQKFFDAGQYELAAAALEMASQKANDAAARFGAYESRIVSGVERTVTVLKGLRFAGKIAATLIPGEGIFLRGAYAAGYTAVQESGGHAAELALGQRQSFGAGEIFKDAAVEGVLSLFSDITVGQFTNALKLRFGAQLAEEFGPSLSEKILQTGAFATAAPWNAAAGEVLNQIVLGKVSVRNLNDISDLIISRVLQDTGMHFILGFLPKKGHGEDSVTEAETTGKREPVPDEPNVRATETHPPASESPEAAIPAGESAIPGHKLKVTPGGKLVRCTTCAYLADRYAALLRLEPRLKAALESLEATSTKLSKKQLSDRATALEGAFIVREQQMIEMVLIKKGVPEAHAAAFIATMQSNPERLAEDFDLLDNLMERTDSAEARDAIDVPTQTGGVQPEIMKSVRQGATTPALRNWVNQVEGYVKGMADPALPGRVITERMHPDHLFALKRVFQMAGAGDLSVEEMLSIARYRGNLAGLSPAANLSKGAKSYAEWSEHKVSGTKVDLTFKYERYLEEVRAENELEILIEWVRANGPLPVNMKPSADLASPNAAPNPLNQ